MRGGCLGSSVLNPSHLPLLNRWEGQGELVRLQLPSATLKFSPKLKRALITQSTNCASARSGEGSLTSSTSPLCTQPEHSFPLSPNKETRCGVPVSPQLPSSAVVSCPFHRQATSLGGSSCMVKMRPKLPLHRTAKEWSFWGGPKTQEPKIL